LSAARAAHGSTVSSVVLAGSCRYSCKDKQVSDSTLFHTSPITNPPSVVRNAAGTHHEGQKILDILQLHHFLSARPQKFWVLNPRPVSIALKPAEFCDED